MQLALTPLFESRDTERDDHHESSGHFQVGGREPQPQSQRDDEAVENRPDHCRQGEAENGLKAFQLAKKLQPDVIVMDIRMPELNGIEATRKILADLPKTKIIALSVYSDRRYISGMLKAGALGYLLKKSVFEE